MNQPTKRRPGRPRRPARTARGKAILSALDAKGLTLRAAAEAAGLTFDTLDNAIHDDPERMSVRTVARLCGRLGLRLDLVAPGLASFAATSASGA